MFDVHTHLVGGHLGARGLHDILLYHMVVSDLYAAGCRSGARLTQYPGWPTQEEAHQRITEAIPYLPLVRNTSCSWGLRLILEDLYDWREPITADNWRRLDAIDSRAGRRPRPMVFDPGSAEHPADLHRKRSARQGRRRRAAAILD